MAIAAPLLIGKGAIDHITHIRESKQVGVREDGSPIIETVPYVNEHGRTMQEVLAEVRKNKPADPIVADAEIKDIPAPAAREVSEPNIIGNGILKTGEEQLGKPYHLGADGVNATDCGLFTQQVLAEHGVELGTRVADGQYLNLEKQGNTFTDRSQLKEGDLVFFDVPSNREHWSYSDDPSAVNSDNQAYKGITHVGIYAGEGKVLQAGSHGVSYASINDFGNIAGYGRSVEGEGKGAVARNNSTDGATRGYDEVAQQETFAERQRLSEEENARVDKAVSDAIETERQPWEMTQDEWAEQGYGQDRFLYHVGPDVETIKASINRNLKEPAVWLSDAPVMNQPGDIVYAIDKSKLDPSKFIDSGNRFKTYAGDISKEIAYKIPVREGMQGIKHSDFTPERMQLNNIEYSRTLPPKKSGSSMSSDIEYSRSSPANEQSKTELINRAHDAAMKNDYESAYDLARQSGDTAWENAFKLLRDTNGGAEPIPPRLGGSVKGEYSGGNITKKTLLERARDIFAPIRTGRIGQSGVEGFINHKNGVIRSRSYGDLDTISHEIGHLVDAALNLRKDAGAFDGEFAKIVNERFGEGTYEPGQIRGEGISEFMKDYVIDHQLAKQNFPKYFSAFEEALAKNADVSARVKEYKDMIQSWNSQSPEARGRSGVSYEYENKKDIAQKIKEAWFATQEQLFDDKVGLARFTTEYEKLTGKKLSTENDPYKMGRLAQNSATARAQMLVEGKNPEMVQKVLNKFYGDSIKDPVTMKEILDSLNDPSLQANEAYLKNGNFKDWHEALDTLLVARRQIELQKLHPDYQGPISKADAEYISNHAPRLLHDIAEKAYQYNNNILSILAHEGLIKQEVYDTLTAKYKNYISMAREFTDEASMETGMGMGKGFGNVRNALKKISEDGSARSVISPLESMVKNTYSMINLVERNRVGKIFAKLADETGVGRLVEEVAGNASTKDSTFSVWENGEKHSYQTTPDLYRAIMTLNQESSNAIMQIMAKPAGWLRAGATLTPDFALKNFARDSFSALVFTRNGFVPVIDHFKGLASLVKKDELFHEYKASGALMSTMTSLDRNYTYDSIQTVIKGEGWKQYNPIELCRAFSEAVETSTRLGEYGKARSKGKTIADAALSAKDITLDFSKAGIFGKSANKIVPFFNAAIQEPARLVQAFKESPAGTSARIGLFITAPSMLLWSMNHDQEWYKELPQYQKDLFWIFKSGETVYRIPKPFGLGVFFGSGPERMLDHFYGKDPNAMSMWAKTTFDAFVPNIMPTVFSALAEWNSNYSQFMERNIVPQKELKLPNAMQYGPDTSTLAKFIGEKTDTSPRKLDYLATSLGGGMARQSLNIVDAVNGDRPYKNPYATAFTVDPTKSPQSVHDFYEELNNAEKEHNAGKLTKTLLTGNIKSNYEKLMAANKTMTALNKREREVLQSTKYSPEEKQAKVTELNKKQMQVAQDALKKIKR